MINNLYDIYNSISILHFAIELTLCSTNILSIVFLNFYK